MMRYCTVLCVVLLNLILFVSFSHEAAVGYVHNPACSAPGGCNFFSDIWNITGFPAADDDVYILPPTNITIYINNSALTLSSLHIGDGFSSSTVNFILGLSQFALTSSGVSFEWEDDTATSTVYMYDSSLYTTGKVIGAKLTAINSDFFMHSLYLYDDASFTNSLCIGYDWTLWDTYFYYSSVSLSKVLYGSIYVIDSAVEIDSAQVNIYHQMYGNFSVSDFIECNAITLIDTSAYINGLTQDSSSGSNFNFSISNIPASLYFSTGYQETANVELGNGVSANILGGSMNLLLGEDVNLNFIVEDTNLFGVQQKYSGLIPVYINASATLLKHQLLPINVEMTNTGTLSICGNITILTGVSSKGILNFRQYPFSEEIAPSVIIPSLSIDEVAIFANSSLTVRSQFNTSRIFFGEHVSSFIVDAPQTFVNGSGINLLRNQISFNGTFTQVGGFINFSTFHDTLPSPLIQVSEKVVLESVTFCGSLPSAMQKLILVQSLTRSVFMNNTVFCNSLEGENNLHFTSKDGLVYLERGQPTTHFEFIQFIRHNYIYFILGGIALIGTLFLAFVFYRTRPRKYKPINSSIN